MFNIFNICQGSILRLQELGYIIRKARLARGSTQAMLAAAAGISRTTLNQLENGFFPDIGVRKAQRVLDEVGLDFQVRPAQRPARPNYVRMACTSASVSFRETLTENELVRTLLTGRVRRRWRPHFRVLLEEAPTPVLKGLVEDVGKWTAPGRVAGNLLKIGGALDASSRIRRWLKIG